MRKPRLSVLGEGPAVPDGVLAKLRFRLIARQEAENAGVPYDLVDAVMDVESGYDPRRRGDVGEIGLMQVRPATAAMLGFRGDESELARPATNLHYGAAYLGRAWQLAGGNVCRASMKYRAGHGEDAMSDRSVSYCQRARAHHGGPLTKAKAHTRLCAARHRSHGGWLRPADRPKP